MADKKASKKGTPSQRVSSEAGRILEDKRKPKEDRSVAGYTLGDTPAKKKPKKK
jgi:hypothetical protein